METKIKEIIERIYDVIKTMKTGVKDIILIHDKHIVMIAADTKLSVIELPDSTCISICCRFEDIILASSGEGKNKVTWIDSVAYNYDMPMYYKALDTYNRYVTACTECICSIDNFEQMYPAVCEVGSKSNYVLFNVNGLSFTMVPGIIKLNKGDTVAFDLYKGMQKDTFILRFDVFKKKLKNTISIYLCQFKIGG